TKRFATLTCHRCCYDIEKKWPKKWKNIAKGSFYQKMYKNIICSFLNSKYFIFPRIFLYLSTLQNGRSCGPYFRPCGETVRPILTKSLLCRLLLTCNIHRKILSF
ncbi:hypothetical protein WDU94_012238, partial [Cyamophila willieti]